MTKRRILMIIFLSLLTVGAYWGYSTYRDSTIEVQAKERIYSDDTEFSVKNIQLFGENQQYAFVQLDKLREANVLVGYKYLVIFNRYNRHKHYAWHDSQIYDGEHYDVTAFNFDTGAETNFELNKKISNQFNGYSAGYPLSDIVVKDNTEYILVEINNSNTKENKHILVNIETQEITEVEKQESVNDTLSTALGITHLMFNFAKQTGFGVQYDGIGIDNKASQSLLSSNFAVQYPDMTKLIEPNTFIARRQGMSSDEDYFNNILNWLAPQGQETIGLENTYQPTGEVTAINSYQDYLNWYDSRQGGKYVWTTKS